VGHFWINKHHEGGTFWGMEGDRAGEKEKQQKGGLKDPDASKTSTKIGVGKKKKSAPRMAAVKTSQERKFCRQKSGYGTSKKNKEKKGMNGKIAKHKVKRWRKRWTEREQNQKKEKTKPQKVAPQKKGGISLWAKRRRGMKEKKLGNTEGGEQEA